MSRWRDRRRSRPGGNGSRPVRRRCCRRTRRACLRLRTARRRRRRRMRPTRPAVGGAGRGGPRSRHRGRRFLGQRSCSAAASSARLAPLDVLVLTAADLVARANVLLADHDLLALVGGHRFTAHRPVIFVRHGRLVPRWRPGETRGFGTDGGGVSGRVHGWIEGAPKSIVGARCERRLLSLTRLTAFHHEALLYAGEQEFLARALAFIEQGTAQGEAVLVAVSEQKIDLLRRALGPAASAVRFADMADDRPQPGDDHSRVDRVRRRGGTLGSSVSRHRRARVAGT